MSPPLSYHSSVVQYQLNRLEMYQMMLTKWLRGNRRLSREQKAKEELKWRQVVEDIQMEEEGVSPVIDSFTGYTGDAISGWTQVCVDLHGFYPITCVNVVIDNIFRCT